jgi:polyhydroxyalkanoate synthesis regulator phasin
MQSLLQSAVSSGSVSATDQTALSGAIDDIGSAMCTGASSASASASATTSTTDTSDPTSMKDKIDGLIDKEVSDGKLTSDQATELKDLFAKAAVKMAGHGHHGPRPSSSDDLGSTSATDSSTSSSSAIASLTSDLTSVANDAISALTSFLDKLKDAAKSNAVYGASGTANSDISSLLVNSAA